MSTCSILKAAGFGPRMGYAGFGSAVWLADAVASTISCPINRALHEASAARTLAETPVAVLEPMEEQIIGWAEFAEAQPATPAGAIELWGNLLQLLDTEV